MEPHCKPWRRTRKYAKDQRAIRRDGTTVSYGTVPAMPWSFLRLLPFSRGSRLHAVTRSAVLPGGYVPAVVYERCRPGRRLGMGEPKGSGGGHRRRTVRPLQRGPCRPRSHQHSGPLAGSPSKQLGRGMCQCGQWGGGRLRKSPNPAAPSRSRSGRENSRDFPSPDPDWAGIGGTLGIFPRFPIWPGSREIGPGSGNPEVACSGSGK